MQAVAQATSSSLEREAVSLRRGGLAKREDATTPPFLFSSSCLGDRSSPERENPLISARPVSLSEKLGLDENVFSSVFTQLLDVCHMFGLITLLKHELGDYVWAKMVHGLWWISLTWSWHVTCMEWLVLRVTLNWHEKWFYIDWWNMMVVWLGRNSTIDLWWCLIGQGVIPWISRWDLMMVPHLVRT